MPQKDPVSGEVFMTQDELVEARMKEEQNLLPVINDNVVKSKNIKELHLKTIPEMAEVLTLYLKAFLKRGTTGTITYNIGKSLVFTNKDEDED